jgi:large subunit ribosomal protein L18
MKKNILHSGMKRDRIKRRMKNKIIGTQERPRLTVYRSLKAIYVQLVDDISHTTLINVSSNSKALSDEIKNAKSKVEIAKIVGHKLGKEAKTKNIEKIVFDRSGYLYHGRVKAVAEGAREEGLIF